MSTHTLRGALSCSKKGERTISELRYLGIFFVGETFVLIRIASPFVIDGTAVLVLAYLRPKFPSVIIAWPSGYERAPHETLGWDWMWRHRHVIAMASTARLVGFVMGVKNGLIRLGEGTKRGLDSLVRQIDSSERIIYVYATYE